MTLAVWDWEGVAQKREKKEVWDYFEGGETLTRNPNPNLGLWDLGSGRERALVYGPGSLMGNWGPSLERT